MFRETNLFIWDFSQNCKDHFPFVFVCVFSTTVQSYFSENFHKYSHICAGIKAVATPDSALELPLTAENVETVLDEIRPYLIADGGNVALHEIDGNVVKLKLQGACGSCPSSVVTMKMGIERRLMEKIPEVVAVESIPDQETGLEMNEENIEKVNIFST